MRHALALMVAAAALAGVVLHGAATPPQANYPSGELYVGERLYAMTCTRCHGPDGDWVPGADLRSGKFRRASTDPELKRLIVAGIPGTAMTPLPFPDGEATALVVYLRAIAAPGDATSAPAGDAARGRQLYERHECARCHRIRGEGARTGPDLSTIARLRSSRELERALLDPSADILPENRSYRVITRAGTVVEGRLLNHDTFTVQVLDTSERLASLAKADLREYGFLRESPMPSYRGRLNAQEAADLVTYLASLK